MSFLIFLADTVDSITPDKVRGLRDMLNSSAMDIMYYTSPLYRDEVSLKNLLLGGKPAFGGKNLPLGEKPAFGMSGKRPSKEKLHKGH